MQLTITTPYRENSIVSIARSAASHDQLARFYTSLYLARWENYAQCLPLVGPRIAQELGRRAFAGIPVGCTSSAGTLAEVVHIAARRLPGKRRFSRTAQSMYWAKARFDRAVARCLRREDLNVLVGMYGASLESFRVVRQRGGLVVLNFVNSHPLEHNRYLEELANLKAPHHELVPEEVCVRVERELEVADLVLVPSRFVAAQLLEHGVSTDKIAVLPYGVDLRAFTPRLGIPRGAERGLQECLYVGQISHRKGIRVLLDAAKRCCDLPVRFRLIGPIVSPEVLYNLPDNVIYEGPSFPGGVAEAMRRADLFVLPTIEDACSLVILEAMASGLPVITTQNNGSSELIDNDHDGMVVPAADIEALGDAISRLVEQPELRLRVGEAAREKVQGAYSWGSYGESVLAAVHTRFQQAH